MPLLSARPAPSSPPSRKVPVVESDRVYPSGQAAFREYRDVPAAAGDGSMPPRQVKVLGAVAWWSAIGIDAPSVVGVAFVAGYSPTNSSFEKMRGALRSAGLVDYPSAGTMRLTPEGWKVTPRPTTPGTLAELHAKVLARLEPRHTRILQPVLDAFPDALSVEDLAAASGYSPTNSSFEKARGKLRSLGLFEYPRPGVVRATDVLFPEVLRG